MGLSRSNGRRRRLPAPLFCSIALQTPRRALRSRAEDQHDCGSYDPERLEAQDDQGKDREDEEADQSHDLKRDPQRQGEIAEHPIRPPQGRAYDASLQRSDRKHERLWHDRAVTNGS